MAAQFWKLVCLKVYQVFEIMSESELKQESADLSDPLLTSQMDSSTGYTSLPALRQRLKERQNESTNRRLREHGKNVGFVEVETKAKPRRKKSRNTMFNNESSAEHNRMMEYLKNPTLRENVEDSNTTTSSDDDNVV